MGQLQPEKKNKSLLTYLGSRGNKIFLKKWGISINFFEKIYLRSGLDNKKKLIFRKYEGELKEPQKNLFYYIELFKVNLQKIYLNIINYK